MKRHKRDKAILLTVIGFFAIAFVFSLLPAGVPCYAKSMTLSKY